MTITIDIYFITGVLIGMVLSIPTIILTATFFLYWPGRFVQAGEEIYTPLGKFRFIRRIWNAYKFWFIYDVIWW